MAEKLRREFIELLEKDLEFRYTVAGFLGLSEILKRMDRLEEGQKRLWEEVRLLREGQEKLWEGQNKLWEEVRSLREGQNRLAAEQERMRKYMVAGFKDLSRTLGITFEDHAASFLEVMLIEMGYPEARVERKHLVYEGEVIEINLFCEEPLVIGEATVSIRSAGDAEKEVEKLGKRAKIVEEKYGRKPTLTILSVARVTPEIAETLRHMTEKHGIKLILGKEIEESLYVD
ncbi:MAG: hypothetical protein FGF53_08975 [Candidatus Brockarchaeota archaeon]|nr:hypothetical protein [Candidatus Brockarchaeota archaeon]MBO3810158.1 hypothetical protein [Candidatus Brockarchaeota archaeon]